jgi:hypothetical protein
VTVCAEQHDDRLLAELDRLDRTLRRLEGELVLARTESLPPAGAQPPSPPPGPRDEQLFDLRVEVDAGPFADFDELTAFEHRLAVLAHVGEVYVRRFFAGRAIVEIAADRKLPLVAVLHDALPGGFSVELAERDALKITLAAPLAP